MSQGTQKTQEKPISIKLFTQGTYQLEVHSEPLIMMGV